MKNRDTWEGERTKSLSYENIFTSKGRIFENSFFKEKRGKAKENIWIAGNMGLHVGAMTWVGVLWPAAAVSGPPRGSHS